MEDKKYYSGEKLLGKLDLDGNRPEIYVCDGTKTAGKTFYFKSLMMDGAINNGNRYAVVTRTQGDASAVALSFMEDLGEKYPGLKMETKAQGKGKVYTIYLIREDIGKKDIFGYAIPLSSLEYVKRNSSMFNSVEAMFFDEFQRQDGRYMQNEVFNLINIHRAVARGYNKQYRYVPLYLVGNAIDLYNPYYIKMGISARLQPDTHFLRGHGWVMEHTVNSNASDAIGNSGVTKALGDDEESRNALTGDKYLNDPALVVKAKPASCTRMCTLIDKGEIDLWFINTYGNPMIYVTDAGKPGECPRYCVRTGKIGENVIFIPSSVRRMIIRFMRGGSIRFVGGKSKDVFFSLIDKL